MSNVVELRAQVEKPAKAKKTDGYIDGKLVIEHPEMEFVYPETAQTVFPRVHLGDIEIPTPDAVQAAVDEIVETCKLRHNYHRAEKSLILQQKALCRRFAGDKKLGAEYHKAFVKKDVDHPFYMVIAGGCMPLHEAAETMRKSRMTHEKRLVEIIEGLPIRVFAEIPGIGKLGIALLIGEIGNLSNYETKQRVWKRMGVACLNGERQRRVSGPAAIDMGYSPRRRSVLYTIGDSIVKCRASPYRTLYDARKEFEIARSPKILPKHAHLKSQRFMERGLLTDIWKQWRELHDR